MNKHERRAFDAGVRAYELEGDEAENPFTDGPLFRAWADGVASIRPPDCATCRDEGYVDVGGISPRAAACPDCNPDGCVSYDDH